MSKLNERLFAAGLFLFLVSCETGSVNGLSCYECTSSADGDLCLDNFNRKLTKPIDCITSVFTQRNIQNEDFICVYTKEQNSTYTIHTRRCGLQSEASICDQSKEENKERDLTKCVTCDIDLCNASTTTRNNLFLLGFIIANCINLINLIL